MLSNDIQNQLYLTLTFDNDLGPYDNDLFYFQITQGNLALFCTHTLGMGQHFSTFITIIMVTNSSVYFYISVNSIYILSKPINQISIISKLYQSQNIVILISSEYHIKFYFNLATVDLYHLVIKRHQPFAVFRSGILCKRGSARRELLQLACWSVWTIENCLPFTWLIKK